MTSGPTAGPTEPARNEGEFEGFEIDGKRYPPPSLASFDMDEAQILWDYTGLGLEDVAPDGEDGSISDERFEELAKIFKNPAFRRTLMHVAYRRGNPTASRKRIEAAIGKVKNVQALTDWLELLDREEDDAGPPDSASELDESSPRSSPASNESSGLASEGTSDEPDDLPATTGATRSDTSSPASALTT